MEKRDEYQKDLLNLRTDFINQRSKNEMKKTSSILENIHSN